MLRHRVSVYYRGRAGVAVVEIPDLGSCCAHGHTATAALEASTPRRAPTRARTFVDSRLARMLGSLRGYQLTDLARLGQHRA